MMEAGGKKTWRPAISDGHSGWRSKSNCQLVGILECTYIQYTT